MNYPELERLRAEAYAMLKPSRIAHVRGCEEEAARLAARWDADETDARMAAIVHDCTKKEPLERQLELCRKYGLVPDAEEEKSAALLHSKTGAAVAKNVFGLPDRVCEAVKWHTTGKPDMSLLEKIIYLADFIEPTRSFDGLDRVRLLAYEDIDRAIAEAMRLSLENMGERGIEPHKNTVEALAFLTEKIKDRTK